MTRRTGPGLRDRRRPRRSRPPGRAAVLAVVVALAGPLATPTTGFAQDRHVVVTGADGLAWLALGDSFSSGEGIPGTTQIKDTQGKDCARATGELVPGTPSDAEAWPVVAYNGLKDAGFSSMDFVACTGSTTDALGTQVTEAQQSGRTTWDLVSMSFGGNNIKFPDIVFNCLNDPDTWDHFTHLGCDITLDTIKRRIDMLAGQIPINADDYEGTTTLPQLYDKAAALVKQGGNVVVAGYPQIIEEVNRWPDWRKNVLLSCEGVLAKDVPMLRSAADYLNEKIQQAVEDAGKLWASRGVSFTYADLENNVYESPNGRHALCSGDPWLNGITTGVSAGDVRIDRSFHPKQLGHQAAGDYLASLVGPLLYEPNCLLPQDCDPLPALSGCDHAEPAPAVDDAATYALHQDLDGNYYRPYLRSEPTSTCGANSIVVANTDQRSGNPTAQRIDIRTYDPAAKQWSLVKTLDTHTPQTANSQPHQPSDGSCQSTDCVKTAHIADGEVDFLVQGGNATLANGLTVVSERDGVFRLVPFLDQPPSTGSTTYVPAATLVGNEVHVDVNACKPDCASGGHSTVVYTYNVAKQAFEGTLGAGTPTSTATLAPTVPVTSFYTPSRNILCGQTSGQLMCFINQHDFTVPGSCDIGQPGLTFIVDASGPARVSNCANDISIKYSREAGVVDYGTTADLGVATCEVSEQGVVCTNSDGHGISLAKGAWSQF